MNTNGTLLLTGRDVAALLTIDECMAAAEDAFRRVPGHALNYCMLLPGPEAQQLAIYIGWLLHRTWGGIVAGAFFVIPSVFVLRR